MNSPAKADHPAPPSDGERQALAWRKAIQSSISETKGDHGTVKVSKFFRDDEASQVAAIAEGRPGIPVAAGWIDGELSWILLTRSLLFKDSTWRCVSAWGTNIDWGDFKGHDKQRHRKAVVKAGGNTVGEMTYETGKASMVPMNAWLTIARLRRPDQSCCDTMEHHLNYRCDKHEYVFECPDNIIIKSKNGSVGIIIHDGGSSFVAIQYCPWCGQRISEIGDP